MSKENDLKKIKPQTYEQLVKNSETLKKEGIRLKSKVRSSMTGIINLVINYENPSLIKHFLNNVYNPEDLYKNTIEIDAVELQQGKPGKGLATEKLDEMIYGSFVIEENDMGMKVPVIDEQTGKRMRNSDGFVNRPAVLRSKFDDKTLIINNLDACMDFCRDPGKIDLRSLPILDAFRAPMVRRKCRLLLISNIPLEIPFETLTLTMPTVTDYEGANIIAELVKIFENKGHKVKYTETEKEQVCRKLVGLTYSTASECLMQSMIENSQDETGDICFSKVLKNLRKKINESLMKTAEGISQITARPWEDYICPQDSNFTFDVQKLLRDFKEISKLNKSIETESVKDSPDLNKINELETIVNALEFRIPNVIVLHGKGGVGKSAFPVHLGGLLGFDVWDFNIGASHSKWVGEGGERIRKSLSQIVKASHVVVRIDEYDRAIGAEGNSGSQMHSAHKQVESEFMNWLQNNQEENVLGKKKIILVLTTNHKENITGPLLRSGRADLVIDIGEFGPESIEEVFHTSARRLYNRGVNIIGCSSAEELQTRIDSLDIKQLANLCSRKGFTVRDVETLIIEMAAHDYYSNSQNDPHGLKWDTETFVNVLNESSGSIDTSDGETKELELGDRVVIDKLKNPDKYDDDNCEYPFEDTDTIYDESMMEDLEKNGFSE